MKSIIQLLFLFVLGGVNAQQSGLSLKQCIAIALNEKPDYKVAKIKVENSTIDIKAAKSSFGPKIGLSYAYRYNAIIPTSLVPRELGGMDTMSSNGDFLELQFGTEWQQDLGITLEQPLIDFEALSEVVESRINKNVFSLKQDKSRQRILYNVIESYILL